MKHVIPNDQFFMIWFKTTFFFFFVYEITILNIPTKNKQDKENRQKGEARAYQMGQAHPLYNHQHSKCPGQCELFLIEPTGSWPLKIFRPISISGLSKTFSPHQIKTQSSPIKKLSYPNPRELSSMQPGVLEPRILNWGGAN